jgi:hypothetical protein
MPEKYYVWVSDGEEEILTVENTVFRQNAMAKQEFCRICPVGPEGIGRDEHPLVALSCFCVDNLAKSYMLLLP